MPIPDFDHNEVLPPHIGDVTQSANMSPYRVSIGEIVQKYGTSNERVNILQGLIELRSDLRQIGISAGFQWLDGSFVENVEKIRSAPPNDIDVVTFFRASIPSSLPDPAVIARLSDHDQTKGHYHVDHFLIHLGAHAEHVVDGTRFYFGLFSHQRSTAIWKGMLQIDLMTEADDTAALQTLSALNFP